MKGIGIVEVAFTGYAVTDMERARCFYGEVLGLDEGMVFDHGGEVGWVEYALPGGHTLALARSSDEWLPSRHGGGICFEVVDLDDSVRRLESAGVTIVMPIQEFPVCRLALIADPDGNTLALHQKKSNHPEVCHHS